MRQNAFFHVLAFSEMRNDQGCRIVGTVANKKVYPDGGDVASGEAHNRQDKVVEGGHANDQTTDDGRRADFNSCIVVIFLLFHPR